MLVGCKLRKIDAFNESVESDSFSAIQWESGKSKCPWRLANWVEEVLCIARRLKCTFKHILREANEVADSLAREGASFVVCGYFVSFLCCFCSGLIPFVSVFAS